MDRANLSDRSSDLTSDVGSKPHAFATGAGALGGAAAGATVGMAAGPVGAVVGGLLGAVVGGMGADAVATSIDQVEEARYWRENYANRPYVSAHATYDDLAPAYAYGVSRFEQHTGRTFEDIEAELAQDWPTQRGPSELDWETAKHATRDAWYRLDQRTPASESHAHPKAR